MVMIHWRLLLGLAVGAVAWGVASVVGVPATLRGLVAWNLGGLVYLLLTWRLFVTEKEADVRARAAREDERRGVILAVVVIAVVAAVTAIIGAEISARRADQAQRLVIAGLSAVTLLISWLVLQSVFVAHYAHRHFQTLEKEPEAFVFPGQAPSTYMDFVYLAFCVGATAQVSDPGVATTRLRNLVTTHAVLAFFYNTTILAVGVGILAGLLAG